LEENPEQDFLGGIFMELNLGNGKNGQFFTPYHICDLMAKIAVDDVSKEIDEKGYVTIHDPCCGAGATLIAGVHEVKRQLEKKNLNYQNHVLVVAQDIDEVVALMCYIHLSLLGVAAYIKVGDVFCDPIKEGDSTGNYWFTMMYFSDVWQTRRIVHRINDILKGDRSDGT
ncbi:N-6 DNA methylase, partial [Bacteroides caecimuris]|uniref:N-6 DNA methylase n=3 Tax=Bacteroidia TaxID=200643 RepID=UPI0026497BED